MFSITKSIIAGFAGTLALSALMVIKTKVGLLPDLNPIQDLAGLLVTLTGEPLLPLGWVLHFTIGAFIWGPIYGLTLGRCAKSAVIKGLGFGVVAWFLMMTGFEPLVGHGLFAATLGKPVIVATLALHLVFGLVLSTAYSLLTESK